MATGALAQDPSSGDTWGEAEWSLAAQKSISGTIRQIDVAVDRSVWVATSGGLVRWSGYGEPQRVGVTEGLRQSDLSSVLVLRDQRVAVAGPYGVEIYDPKLARVVHPVPLDMSFRWSCERLAEGPDGSLWVATGEGAMRLRAGKRAQLFGASARIARLAEHLAIDTVALPETLLDRKTISRGTGVVQMPIRGENVVVEVCKGSPAEKAAIQAGDTIRISPAPNTPGGRIKFRFEIQRGSERWTHDERARTFRASSLHFRARDLLIDRFATLWISSGQRLVRAPLRPDGSPDLARTEVAELIGSARDLSLSPSRALGAVWVFSRRSRRFAPQLFGSTGLRAIHSLALADGVTDLLDMRESSVGAIYAATMPHGLRVSERRGDWEVVRTQAGYVESKTLCLSPDDRLTAALLDGGVARCLRSARLRRLDTGFRIVSLGRDGSRWSVRENHAVVCLGEDDSETRYDASPFFESSKWELVGHSRLLAWAVDSSGTRVLRFADRKIQSFEIPDFFGSPSEARCDLRVCAHGDAWVGPFGSSELTIVRFGADGLRHAYRLPPTSTKERAPTLPIFRYDGKVFLVSDEDLYELPEEGDALVYALDERDRSNAIEIPALHGAICSVVSTADEIWFATMLGEVLQHKRGRSTRRYQLPFEAPATLRRAPDASIWAIRDKNALLYGAGDWLPVLGGLEGLGGDSLSAPRILPRARDDVFVTPRDRGAMYRWQESSARPQTRIAEATRQFYVDEDPVFDLRTQQRWHPEEENFEYQHRLDDAPWSTWSADPRVSFQSLDVGDYVLELRSRRTGTTILSDTVSHTFRVRRVWSPIALSIAVLSVLTLLGFFFWRLRPKDAQQIAILEAQPTSGDGSVARARNTMRPPLASLHRPSVCIAGSDLTGALGTRAQSDDRIRDAALQLLSPELEHDVRNLRMLLTSKLAELSDGRVVTREERSAAENAMRSLIGDLHAVTFGPRAVDVHTTLRQCAADCARLLPSEIRMLTDLRASRPYIEIARGQLVQVFLNLVFNARDALVGHSDPRIVVRTRDLIPDEVRRLGSSEGLCLEIEDNGVGMDAITSEQCFQDRYTTKFGASNRGLGLSTVRRIVDGFGGEIAAKSEPRSGCRFRILLPRSRRPRRELRVLVCEDHEGLRTILVRGLRSRGIHAIEVANAKELRGAYAMDAGSAPYDAMVMDVRLDGRNGIALAKELRAAGHNTPTLFVSGANASEFSSLLESFSQSAFLAKPFGLDQLEAALRGLLPEFKH